MQSGLQVSDVVPKWRPISYQVVPIGFFWFSNNFDLPAAARVPIFHVVIEDRCDLRSVRMGGRSVVGLNSYKSSLRSYKLTLKSFSGWLKKVFQVHFCIRFQFWIVLSIEFCITWFPRILGLTHRE